MLNGTLSRSPFNIPFNIPLLLRPIPPRFISPRCQRVRSFRKPRVDVLLEGDVALQYARLAHEADDQLEVLAPRRERLVLHAIDRIEQRPAEKPRVLAVVVAADEIGGVLAMRAAARAVLEPQPGPGDAVHTHPPAP